MVAGFIKNFTRHGQTPYQVSRLLNSKMREGTSHKLVHLVCDIDKTYLETEFENKLSLAKIAFENAVDKVTVAGAATVLNLARWGDVVYGQPLAIEATEGEERGKGVWPRPLHFVSSSPPQLRSVLEEKLAMDGLDWTSDTFKDQVYNIRMGRMDLLRQHVAYKSLAILSVVDRADEGSEFVLIGDNAESDPFIYLGVKLLLSGQLSLKGYLDYIERAGVEPQVIGDLQEFLQAAKGLSGQGELINLRKKVRSIYIRRVPGYPSLDETELTGGILLFDSFFQVALNLIVGDLLVRESLKPLLRYFHNIHGQTWEDLAYLAQQVLWGWRHRDRQKRLLIAEDVKGHLVDFGYKNWRDSLDQSPGQVQGSEGDAVASTNMGKTPYDFLDGPNLSESELLAAASRWLQKLQGRRHRS